MADNKSLQWTGGGGTQQPKRRVGGNAEDEGGLGRGVSKRVQTDRTLATTWAKDGEGNDNDNNTARSLLSAFFSATLRFIVMSQCPPQRSARAPPWQRVDDDSTMLVATEILGSTANGHTEVMEMIGIQGAQVGRGG